ncbi:MAG: hypothetical protein U0353_32885 [Sandaracinus sp.]
MSELVAFDVEALPRAIPLAPTCCLVEGTAAAHLARRLVARMLEGEAVDARLVGVASVERRYVVLSGPSDALPWIDGARYLGIDPDAPRLRLSCTHAPALSDGRAISPGLVERAVLARVRRAEASGPFVVLRRRVIALGESRPLDRAMIERFVSAIDRAEDIP